ncbi:MAG: YcgL domain-containing protein [Gammaproteobacteria bacterium]|nr:YcgL domain-containing protein [Gammaproteobacteria bacterium]
MICFIYRSERKADTYLYLLKKDDFSRIPPELLQVFGEPEFSFQFTLTPERSLAKEDPAEVYANLQRQGYHLQLQDDLLIEQKLALKSLN